MIIFWEACWEWMISLWQAPLPGHRYDDPVFRGPEEKNLPQTHRSSA